MDGPLEDENRPRFDLSGNFCSIKNELESNGRNRYDLSPLIFKALAIEK